ncbi:tumor necrosis factor receptor superfamily member 6-like isoform X2 [Hippocampus comes]|uniref:tumor necrosis factor receptor superfamily member 6-like isoform X2 n=1 Tax=Hippocampus comes TaxID=109280 RepID=UPI00094E7329|nr:PREDICTED: tumor necrosis factor receptor superfamily member 6-like isoform X2 [Hippocampus comes]
MRTSYSFFASSLTRFSILVLFGSHLSLGVDASSRLQKKREVLCADGLYQHDSITCCLCAIGQRLKKHCTAASPQDTQCELCEPGLYNSHPNQDSNCKRCTSCSHQNANLEVESACTRARDTKCRCKAHHYCISANDQDCKLCSSCTECGLEGVKVACTATNDTVCNDKLKVRSHVWIAVAVACAAVTIIVIGVCFRRNRKQRRNNQQSSNNPATVRLEMEPINNPSRHLPAIAKDLGWKTMVEVAMRSGMNPVRIDGCKIDNPHDSEERTLQLLRMWTQEQGMDAMKNLIQILHDIKQKGKAQKVKTTCCSLQGGEQQSLQQQLNP